MVAMLVVVYREISPWTLPLFFGPALAAQRLFVMYQAKSALAESLSAANSKLEGASLAFATSLVGALEARDKYTAGHSVSVATLAERIACALGLDSEQCALVYRCGLVHDIGKISLPVGLLEKQGPLTQDDLALLQQHPGIGEEILARSEMFSEMADIVRSHHERIDGTGYPDGLHGYDIPLLSRIITVADAYDAMTADRPYRKALPWSTAMERLIAGAGQQFDPVVVDAFTSLATSDNYFETGASFESTGSAKADHAAAVNGNERTGAELRPLPTRTAVTA
jgi:putative nucleotidyltransferase with HDIG domain